MNNFKVGECDMLIKKPSDVVNNFNVGECVIINNKVNVFDGIEWIDIKSKPFEIIKFLLTNDLKFDRISNEKYEDLLNHLLLVEAAVTHNELCGE